MPRKSSKKAALEREAAAAAPPADIIVNDSETPDDDLTNHLDAIQGEVVDHPETEAEAPPPNTIDAEETVEHDQDVVQMISDFIALRNAKSEMVRKCKEKEAQFDAAMENIENKLRQVSKATGLQTFGAPGVGTVYFSEATFVKVMDKATWIKWLGDSYAATKGMSAEQAANVVNIISSMLTTHTSKEGILQFMAQFQTAIPGIDVTRIKKLYVRKK